jgi:hypothetical protein
VWFIAMCRCRSECDLAARLRAIFGPKTRPQAPFDAQSIVETTLTTMRNLHTAGVLTAAIDPIASIASVDRSKALLDSAGHPGLSIWQSMSGATAEKASLLGVFDGG